MSDLPTDRDPIDALAEEFVARYRRGESPSIADYAARHPELADEIRDLFPAATLLEDLKGPPGAAARPAQVPTELGDYRILREVGRGGMGVVYEAEQVSLGRKVALKVLVAHGRLAPQQLERFRREAQAAGRLHHTNIVPVFGVGEHDGTPYYVMQFIAGQGLDRLLARLRAGRPLADSTRTQLAAADTQSRHDTPPVPGGATEVWGEAGPTPRPVPAERGPVSPFDDPNHPRFVAQVGAQVAHALEHAHRQGILHRDIKPANLLLDGGGTVWVTDFGLAKLLDHDDLTRPGDVAGTLRYSAPERFRGQSDARGDVYSLGLTLYELLTLRAAYDEPDPSRLLLQVTQGRFAPPRAANPAVPRDLETIVLRCLAHEPERRYQTAAELADDLRRFLDDRPIKARRTSFVEHAWRWCRRNPAVASLSALLMVVFLAGFALVAWKWREASASLALVRQSESDTRDALTREEQQRGRAEGNLDLALDAFERIARQLAVGRPGVPLDAGEETATPVVTQEVAAVLQDIVGFQERFAATNSNDPRLKRDTARALRQVGTIRMRLGEYPAAVEALTRAAEILAGEADQKLELAQTYNDLGAVLRAAGKFSDAVAAHEQARDRLEDWTDPAPARVRLELARTHNMLGATGLWQKRGQSGERGQQAERSQRKALELLAQLVEEDKSHPEYRHLLARATYDLAHTLWGPSRRQESGEARARALEIQEKLAADFPAVPDYRAELAEMLLATYPRNSSMKSPGEAEKSFGRAAGLAADLVAKHPAVPDYRALLARARSRQAYAQLLQPDREKDATTNLRQAVKLSDSLAAGYPSVRSYRFSGFESKWMLGDLLRRAGTPKALEESSKLLTESFEELKKVLGVPPRNPFARALLSRHARSLAETVCEQGKTEEAEQLFRLAEELAQSPKKSEQ